MDIHSIRPVPPATRYYERGGKPRVHTLDIIANTPHADVAESMRRVHGQPSHPHVHALHDMMTLRRAIEQRR